MPSNGAGAAAFQDRDVAPAPRARLRTSIRRDLNLKPPGAGCGQATDADFADYRRARAWTAWKQTMWETGHKLPTQTQEGRARCFCGAEIDIASMDGHVRAAHMIETADV